VTIEPDTKDWTWVLKRRCPECGFDGSAVDVRDVPGLVRANAAAWPAVLSRPDVARRARPDRWSDLEYACHVRDVFRLFRERLALMLADDDAHFANWDQDATAIEARYDEQDRTLVARDLLEAGAELADAFANIGPDQWQRTGVRSDGAVFTVETFARYLAHDPIHHLWDVGAAPETAG
jgi:DinB superfamily